MLTEVVLLAAVTAADMPQSLRGDFLAGRYEQMIQRVDSLIANPVGLTLRNLALLHVWKGFALAASGDRLAARASFATALSLDGRLTLDPREVSPKILTEFEAARSSRTSGPEAPAVIYLVTEDVRPTAALRSVLLPGWGQWTMGRKGRGALFGAAACGALGGWIAAARWEDRAHDRYLAASGDDIASAYDDYDRAFKTRRTLGYATIAVWAAAVVDVLLGPSPPMRIAASTSGVEMGVTFR